MANDSISALGNAKYLSKDGNYPAGTVKVNVDAAMSVNASILRVVVQDEMQSVLKLGQRKV